MRLQKVWISEYKNLKDFSLDFDGKSFIDIFVGKNGTGKSNLFEALIEIFRHLYATDEKSRLEIGFDYLLEYEINKKNIKIEWTKGLFTINGEKNRKNPGPKTPLPDNVLIYYSGHNVKVNSLVHDYEESFRKAIKKAGIADARKFIGIGREYKELLLSILLLQENNNKAKKFICNKLGIKSVAPEVKLVLKRPFYADSKVFDIELNDETDRYWKPMGITKIFLERLANCKRDDSRGPVRTEGYLSKDDRYIHYFDIIKIRKEFSDLSAQDLFRQFDNLKIIEMLSEISIPIKLENGSEATTDFFSDGQFQLVYIYSILELFKDRNCVTLLDEPDSFLHPEWQFEFLKQAFEITDTAAKNNHVLMSSHSAITLIPHGRKYVTLFHFDKNKLCCHSVHKAYAIDQLSSKLMKYSEDEQILSVIHSINLENKPVFFTEGSTDPIILTEAWRKLYKSPIPFIPIFAFNCSYLRLLLQDERIFNELGRNPMFGLFDFDEAYNQWNSLKGRRIERDPYKGLSIGIERRNSFAFLLPVPNIAEVERQVIKNKTMKETYCHESRMTIEHLFYGDLNARKYFLSKKAPGGSVLTFNSDKKTHFAKEVVPKLNPKHFKVFLPMFEFVRSKCGAASIRAGRIVR